MFELSGGITNSSNEPIVLLFSTTVDEEATGNVYSLLPGGAPIFLDCAGCFYSSLTIDIYAFAGATSSESLLSTFACFRLLSFFSFLALRFACLSSSSLESSEFSLVDSANLFSIYFCFMKSLNRYASFFSGSGSRFGFQLDINLL